MNSEDCQSHCWQQLAEQNPEISVAHSLPRRIKLLVVRNVEYQKLRQFKIRSNRLVRRISSALGRNEPAPDRTVPGHEATVPEATEQAVSLEAGDLVRVRSMDEIRRTLNIWGELRGCSFMPEMEPYCNTTQRVLKPVLRVLNERDYRVKESKGIVLLEGLICEGTKAFGRCDRSCFYFWREEWLERIPEPHSTSSSEDGAQGA